MSAFVLPNGEPVIRLPVPRGEVVLCQQGNASPKPLSHANPNTLHALDLSAPGAGDVLVVAAAPGRVARVVRGAGAGAVTPGYGFGNHVVLAHAGGWFTAYSHLADIRVEEGQELSSGDALGAMGDTGMAGNRHLHFSLHREMGKEGLPDTVPMHGMLLADVSRTGGFVLATSLELTCADAIVSMKGHLYGSENAREERPRFGAPSLDLAATLASRAKERAASIPVDLRGEWVNELVKTRGAAEAKARLLAMLGEHPRDPLVLYWLAVVLTRDLADDAGALARLETLERLQVTEPGWIAPWVGLRIGMIAATRGDEAEARRRVELALATKGQGPEFERLAREAAQRLGLAVPPAAVPAP